MKFNELYIAPEVEVSEVVVEAGFSYSVGIKDTEEGDEWNPAN